MAVVVADSSPVNYLILIDRIDIAAALFGEVIIPEAVFRELQSSGTPPKVAHWISQRPKWLRVEKAEAPLDSRDVEKLGDGEVGPW